MEKHQIFISYRRDGGEFLAGRLADQLELQGYKVFFDAKSMRAGEFDIQILNAIAQCEGVLLVLSPNGLDRCVDNEDWVRKEVAFALENKKKIIPIMIHGFEFPEYMPSDIERIRFMEGISASTEWFEYLVEKINKLLGIDLPVQDKNTKFPVYEDPDFSERDISNIIMYHLLKNPVPEHRKEEVENSLDKYYKLQLGAKDGFEYKGIRGRKILHTVQYASKTYNLYDVFFRDGKKYAYGLEADVSPKCQQIGVFFKIDEQDNIAPILTASKQEWFLDIEATELMTWYAKYRRGLGGVPEAMLHVVVQAMNSTTFRAVKRYSQFIGLDQNLVDSISLLREDEAMEMFEKTNENLLSPIFEGIYKHIVVKLEAGTFIGESGMLIVDNQLYGFKFQKWFEGRIIRTPIGKRIIVDFVPTMLENHYIALTYNKKKKRGSDFILEEPEYYLITKGKNHRVNMDKISEKEIPFWCGKYFERFALIYMQLKSLIPYVFYNK